MYYWKTLLDNKLELKVGFKGRYQSSHFGAEFNPEVLAYVSSSGPALAQASSGDFFVTAHIGDAFIHLMWENLTSVQYFSTPFYPVLERAVRRWSFLGVSELTDMTERIVTVFGSARPQKGEPEYLLRSIA